MKIKFICKNVNKRTGETFPTKKEIASFANRLLNDYCKKFNKTLENIDYDEFVTKYIGVDIQYQTLSSDHSILGSTIQRDGIIETYNCDGTIKFVETHKGDIFIDSLACGSEERELFTTLHEVKHYLLDLDKKPEVYKEVVNKDSINVSFHPKTKCGWAEYFADYFAACILLPRIRIKKIYSIKHTKYVTNYHTSLKGEKIWILKKIINEISNET